MSLTETIAQAHALRSQALGRTAGKWLLTQANPNEFEYYMMALELLDSDLATHSYFVFPIMPSQISYDNVPLTKVTQTAAGVSVLKQDQFNIKKLTLSGSFGRDFKVLMGTEMLNLTNALTTSTVGSALHNFSASIKTGYGCIKYMEAIFKQLQQLDSKGKPHHLILYNLAFNQKFLVELESEQYQQQLDSNMVWNYSITLKAIGDAEHYLGSKIKSTSALVTQDLSAKAMNAAYKKATKALATSYNKIKSSLF